MGLIVSNISGSQAEGTESVNGISLIAVTGSLAFTADGGFDGIPDDTHFYVSGAVGEGQKAAIFSGDVLVDGTLTVQGESADLLIEGDVTIEDSLTVDGLAEVKNGLYVTGGLYLDEADENFGGFGDFQVVPKKYIDDALDSFSGGGGGGFSLAGDAATTDGNGFDVGGEETLTISGTLNQIEIAFDDEAKSLTFGLADDVSIVGGLTVGGEANFENDVIIDGNLTVQGTTTTINTENLLVQDPFVLLANVDGPGGSNTNGGIIILSGASDGSDLAIGRVDSDTWGVAKLDSLTGGVESIIDADLVNFRAAELQVSGADNYIALSNDLDLHIHAENDLLLCAGDDNNLIIQQDEAAWLTFDMSTNEILPALDDSISLGADNKRFKNVYTGDLHLQNDRGSWTLIEEETFITFRNNATGRRYKMLMEDITDSGTYGPGNDGKM